MIRILIVDDSKSVHAFLHSCFGNLQVEVTDVHNGQEAIETLAKRPKDFDLILLDWEMPICDGPTTFARLRQEGHAIPVLMMTTKNEPEDIGRMLEAGVNEYMLKPFTKDVLVEKMEFALGKVVPHVA